MASLSKYRHHARLLSLELTLAALLIQPCVTRPAEAAAWGFTGARYLALGGTRIAFADDSLATYYNPSDLAWRKSAAASTSPCATAATTTWRRSYTRIVR